MKKILLALALLLAPSIAWAQCNGVFPANTLCGNLTASPAVPGPFSASGTIVGPAASTLNGLPKWGNALGTSLIDAANTTIAGAYTWSGNQTWTGTNTFSAAATTFSNVIDHTGTFKVNGQTFTWPAAGTGVVGTATNNTLTGNNTFSTGIDNFTGTFQIGGVTLTLPVTVPNGGTGNATATAHSVPLNQGASAQTSVGPGTTGQFLGANSAADPTYKSGAWTLLATLTASTSASLSDTTSITASYSNYLIVFTQIIPATNGACLTLQVHSGGAFKNTAYLNAGMITSTIAPAVIANILTTAIQLSYDGNTNVTFNPNNATPGVNGTILVTNPSAAQKSLWVYQLGYLAAATTALAGVQGQGIWNSSGAIDGFQVLFNTGNITSGTIKIYGQL